MMLAMGKEEEEGRIGGCVLVFQFGMSLDRFVAHGVHSTIAHEKHFKRCCCLNCVPWMNRLTPCWIESCRSCEEQAQNRGKES